MAIERRRPARAVVRGDRVYLVGQVAEQAAGEPVGVQTREILAAIDGLLAEVGSHKSRLLSASIRLADMATFAEMSGAWDDWMTMDQTPARATIEAELTSPGHLVEIAVIAAR